MSLEETAIWKRVFKSI